MGVLQEGVRVAHDDEELHGSGHAGVDGLWVLEEANVELDVKLQVSCPHVAPDCGHDDYAVLLSLDFAGAANINTPELAKAIAKLLHLTPVACHHRNVPTSHFPSLKREN